MSTTAFESQRRARPILGASLWIFGALSWAYVALGELVVSLGLNEPLAALLVVVILAAAWVRAVRHHGSAGQPGRLVAPGVIGIMLWAALLVLTAVVMGSSRSKDYEAVTVLLCLQSMLAFFLGRRWTNAPRVELSKRQRLSLIAVWIVTLVGTLLALASAFSRR